MPVIPQSIYVGALFVWLLFFLLGKMQYNRVRKQTMELALSKAESLLRTDRALTVERCFEQLLPDWEGMLRKTAWFIPHQTELWPMPARPDYVRRRMNLTPVWLGAFLRLNGFDLPAEPELHKQIEQVARAAARAKDAAANGRAR